MAALMNLFKHDIVSYVDGGGQVRGAGLHPVHGDENVARLVLGLIKRAPAGLSTQFAWVNGEPALVSVLGRRLFNVMVVHIDNARIHSIYSIVNPDKLRPMAQQLGLAVL